MNGKNVCLKIARMVFRREFDLDEEFIIRRALRVNAYA
jgi:hypothetical protein